MKNQDRFYIQSKYESNKFLKKFRFQSPMEYTNIYSYIPSISDFPLSFTSQGSVHDFILNTLISEAGAGNMQSINFDYLQEIDSLKIVKLQQYTSLMSTYFYPECDNSHLENIREYVKKSAFKWVANKMFNSRIMNYYNASTDLNSRLLGCYTNMQNKYIVDTYLDNSNLDMFHHIEPELHKLGVDFHSEWNDKLLVFKDIDSLNFARISIAGSQNWKITREDEIYNLENTTAISPSIQLNYSHYPVYH